MAELPSSWNLTVKQEKGKAVVYGKDDTGNDYRVRTCDTPAVTERDIVEIASADRERTTAAAFVKGVVEDGERRRLSREDEFESELIEAAGPVVHAGLERRGSTVGYSRTYSEAYERIFGG